MKIAKFYLLNMQDTDVDMEDEQDTEQIKWFEMEALDLEEKLIKIQKLGMTETHEYRVIIEKLTRVLLRVDGIMPKENQIELKKKRRELAKQIATILDTMDKKAQTEVILVQQITVYLLNMQDTDIEMKNGQHREQDLNVLQEHAAEKVAIEVMSTKLIVVII